MKFSKTLKKVTQLKLSFCCITNNNYRVIVAENVNHLKQSSINQVTNKGEDDAFRSELSLTLPRNIIFNRRQAIGGQSEEDIGHIKCITKQDEDLTNKVICSLSQELQVGASEIFGLSVITTNIEDLSQKTLVFDFNARVQEPSEELG